MNLLKNTGLLSLGGVFFMASAMAFDNGEEVNGFGTGPFCGGFAVEDKELEECLDEIPGVLEIFAAEIEALREEFSEEEFVKIMHEKLTGLEADLVAVREIEARLPLGVWIMSSDGDFVGPMISEKIDIVKAALVGETADIQLVEDDAALVEDDAETPSPRVFSRSIMMDPGF